MVGEPLRVALDPLPLRFKPGGSEPVVVKEYEVEDPPVTVTP
jgi:hypothetical protein